MNKKDVFLMIPDIYYVSEELLKIKKNNPKKEIIFIIMSCNFSIHMFADLSNVLKMKEFGADYLIISCTESALIAWFNDLDRQNFHPPIFDSTNLASQEMRGAIGEAIGDVTVPAGKVLRLDLSRQGSRDLSPLAKLRPNDLLLLFSLGSS